MIKNKLLEGLTPPKAPQLDLNPAKKPILDLNPIFEVEEQKAAQKALEKRDPAITVPIAPSYAAWPSFYLENTVLAKKGNDWVVFRYEYGTQGTEMVVASQLMTNKVVIDPNEPYELLVGAFYNVAGRIASRRYLDKTTNLWIEKCNWILIAIEKVA